MQRACSEDTMQRTCSEDTVQRACSEDTVQRTCSEDTVQRILFRRLPVVCCMSENKYTEFSKRDQFSVLKWWQSGWG